MSAANPLILAAKRGHHNVVRRLLNEECDVTAQDNAGWTALMHAAFAGHVKAVQSIVEAIPGFENDLYAIDTLRALGLAAYSGNIDVINALVDAGVSVDDRIFWGPESIIYEILRVAYPPGHPWHGNYTAIDVAAARGDVAALEALLQASDSDDYEVEPLEVAAAIGQTSIIKYLRETDSADEEEEVQAVWTAVREGHLETLEVLLEPFREEEYEVWDRAEEYLAIGPVYDDVKRTAGNDVVRLSRVLRCIRRAVGVWWDDLGLIWQLRRTFLLVEAIYKRDLALVEALVLPYFGDVHSDDDIDEEDEEMWLDAYDAVLMASRRYLESVYDPVDEANCTDEIMPTPITLAIQCDFPEALPHMMRAGGHIDGHSDCYGGWAPLHTAANLNKISAVKVLLDLGAKPNHKTANTFKDGGSTPLHYARSPEVAQALLAAAADPNARDAKGRTPLHRLPETMDVWGGDACGTAAALLAGGAAVNAVDDDGSTPLHCACPLMFPRLDLVELLLNAGSDASLHDNSGRTPLGALLTHSSSFGTSMGLQSLGLRNLEVGRLRWGCLGVYQMGVAGALLPVTPGAWETLADAERESCMAAALGPLWRGASHEDYRRMCAFIGKPLDLGAVFSHLDEQMKAVVRATAEGIVRWLPDEHFPPGVRRRVMKGMFAASPYDY